MNYIANLYLSSKFKVPSFFKVECANFVGENFFKAVIDFANLSEVAYFSVKGHELYF